MKKLIIVAGMPRAGSTWLYYNFKNHPNVAMPKYKETFFFGSNFRRGFNWFYSLYDEQALKNNIAFDISPNYYCDVNFFDNIKHFDIDHKVVLILREPAEWLSSFYSQLKSFTPNMQSLDDFLQHCQVDFDGGSYIIEFNKFDFSAVVEKFTDIYKGNILLINFNKIKEDPVAVLNSIESFSGLPQYFNTNTTYSKPVNVSIPKFNIIAYLSTIPFIRKFIITFVPGIIRNKMIDYLYKIGKDKISKDMPDKEKLEKTFRPIYVDKYFKESDIQYL